MYKCYSLSVGLVLLNIAFPAYGKDSVSSDIEFDEILSQDISDLTVTSVSKRSQHLSETAAAVYVITQDEIRRAGIYSIPEALRLVPGIEVAKVSTNRWAVAARGFNSTLDNKLLVLIDGRSIYTPVFSGVYWDDQSTSINDIDRIEVIRGPGSSLYGANAVNGVINIITKSAEDTQGNLISATASSRGNGLYEARHGGQSGNNDYYRTYVQYLDSGSWYRGRGGFRIDNSAHTGQDNYTYEGNAYGGNQDAKLVTATLSPPYRQTVGSTDDSYGADLLSRWNHKISNDSDMSLQAYMDYYSRLESNFSQRVSSADIQFQHSIQSSKRNNFIWGSEGRLYYEQLEGTYSASVNDENANHEILSAFVQDEYSFVPNTLSVIFGSKLEYNDYTGLEIEPTARMTWHPTDKQMVWGAVSRAVRTPSTIEEDISALSLVLPTTPLTEYRVVGNPDQKSEHLIAYEIGHRIQPINSLSLDTALFYNSFDNIQTIAVASPSYFGINGNRIIPYQINNLGFGHVYGAEIAASWSATHAWRLTGSYTYLKMNLDVEPGTATTLDAGEKLAPRNQFSIQSYYNITDTIHWDNMVYYVQNLSPPVQGYVRYDMRIAWLAVPGIEVSLIGRNLVDPHMEFPATPAYEVGRSWIGQVLWKF